MRDAGPLKEALLRGLAERDGAQDDGVENTPPSAQLGRILQEIDAVVLPRDVHLENGTGDVLILTVKARRLIRVQPPIPRALGALPGVVDAELSGHDDQMAALAHLLAAFAARVTTLSVSVTVPKNPEPLTEIGLAVDQLANAIKTAGYALPSDRDEMIEALSELATSNTLTWALFQREKLAALSGDKALLRDCVETALPYLVKSESPADNRALTMIFGAGDAPRTAITLKGQSCIVAKLPKALTQTWICASSGQPRL